MLSNERNFVIVFLVVFSKIDQGIYCFGNETVNNLLSLSTRDRFTPSYSNPQLSSLRDTYVLNPRRDAFKSPSLSLYFRGDSFRSSDQSAKNETIETSNDTTTKNETIETSNDTTNKEEPKKMTTNESIKDGVAYTNTPDNGTSQTISKKTSRTQSLKKTLSKLSATPAGTSISECKTKILNFYKVRYVNVFNDDMSITYSIQQNFRFLDFLELDINDINSAIPDIIDSEPNSHDNLKLKKDIITHVTITTKTPKKRKKVKLITDLLGKFFDYTFQVALCAFNKPNNKLENGNDYCKRVTNQNDVTDDFTDDYPAHMKEFSCLKALTKENYSLDDAGVSFFHAFFISHDTIHHQKIFIRKGFSFNYREYIKDNIVSRIEDDCYRMGKSVEEYCTKLSNSKT